MQQALDFLAQHQELRFIYQSQGPFGTIWEFEKDGREGSVTLQEEKKLVALHSIDIEPQGSGLGAAVIESLRDYCQLENKQLQITGVMNLDFFARFKWLEWSEPKQGKTLWTANFSPSGL